MTNREIARHLRDTARLMEVAGQDSFRIRAYRRAADAVELSPDPISALAAEPRRLLELPGIGPGMQAAILELLSTGVLQAREQLLEHYRPEMLQLLQISGLGPKTIALIFQHFQAASVDEVEKLAREGKLRTLPRMSQAAEAKILLSIENWRRLSGRFLLPQAESAAQAAMDWLAPIAEIQSLTVAGSLRRGKETIGQLHLLASGDTALHQPARDRLAAMPGAIEPGDADDGSTNEKASVRLESGLRIHLHWVAPSHYGATLWHLTGSRDHTLALQSLARQRGYELTPNGLTRAGESQLIAGAVEAEIYQALDLDWIPPELRENGGEIEAAAAHRLPRLLESGQIRGDLHMHTTASDGKSSIEEMADAALARGYEYIAITEHSQALAMARGLDAARARHHLQLIRAADAVFRQGRRPAPGGPERPLRIFTGLEVDILSDGRLDMDDDVLAEMDVVIGSLHSRFDLPPAAMTERILRAIENPHLRILGHLTARRLLRRAAVEFDFEAVLAACARASVALEINASPERLDLNDRNARRCGQAGVPVVISTDAHQPRHFEHMRYGVRLARRAWLEPGQVLNTRGPDEFLAALRPRVG